MAAILTVALLIVALFLAVLGAYKCIDGYWYAHREKWQTAIASAGLGSTLLGFAALALWYLRAALRAAEVVQ